MYRVSKEQWDRIPENEKKIENGVRCCPWCFIDRNAPYMMIYEGTYFEIVDHKEVEPFKIVKIIQKITKNRIPKRNGILANILFFFVDFSFTSIPVYSKISNFFKRRKI